MLVRQISILAVALFLLGACASTPPVQAQYYPPKAQLVVTVSQTLGCNAAGDKMAVATTVSPVVSYVAETGSPQTFSYDALSGTFVDADTAVSFTSDGRLLGINAADTGEGAAIIKAAVALASVAFSGNLAPAAQPVDIKAACTKVNKDSLDKPAAAAAGAGAAKDTSTTTKTVALTYQVVFQFKLMPCSHGETVSNLTSKAGEPCLYLLSMMSPAPPGGPDATLDIPPVADSVPVFADLSSSPTLTASLMPRLSIMSASVVNPGGQLEANKAATGPSLALSKVASVNLDVHGFAEQKDKQMLWEGPVRAPLSDPTYGAAFQYNLPVPGPELFGKEQFVLALGDDGSITKLEYAETSGASDALGAATTVLQAAMPTQEQQATQIQGESDLIYQQHRLVVCQTNPANCASK
jgi:hypothetical protein